MKTGYKVYAMHQCGYDDNPRKDIMGACVAPEGSNSALLFFDGMDCQLVDEELLPTARHKKAFRSALLGQDRRLEWDPRRLPGKVIVQTNGRKSRPDERGLFMFLFWGGNGEPREISRQQFETLRDAAAIAEMLLS